jgi:hypothetical protein
MSQVDLPPHPRVDDIRDWTVYVDSLTASRPPTL